MVKAGSFQGESVNKLGEKDVRFTRNKANNVIYAIVLGWPTEPILVRSLGLTAGTSPGKITRVELLGTGASIDWKQQPDGLHVDLLQNFRPKTEYAAALKLSLS